MSKNLSEPIRSHKDLDKDSVPHYHKAVKFYEGLAKQLVNQGHVLDLFACALDQVLLALLFFVLHTMYLTFCFIYMKTLLEVKTLMQLFLENLFVPLLIVYLL